MKRAEAGATRVGESKWRDSNTFEAMRANGREMLIQAAIDRV